MVGTVEMIIGNDDDDEGRGNIRKVASIIFLLFCGSNSQRYWSVLLEISLTEGHNLVYNDI